MGNQEMTWLHLDPRFFINFFTWEPYSVSFQPFECTLVMFFFGADRHNETSHTSFIANSRGTCEMLRGGLQDFPSHPTSRRAQKQKNKESQRQGQHSRSRSKHVSRGSCKQLLHIPTLGRPDQPRFSRAQLHTGSSLLAKTRFMWEPQTKAGESDSLAGLTNHGSTRSIPTHEERFVRDIKNTN